MMQVRFNRAMRPYGAGDTALLPDDVASRVIRDGDAEKVALAAAPHAVCLGELPSAPAPLPEPAKKPSKLKLPLYRTKEA